MNLPERHKKLQRAQWLKSVFFFGLLFAGLFILVSIENLLLSFVLAIVISFFVSPIISYLEGTGIGRTVSILIVFSFFSTLTGLLIWAISPFLMTQFSSLKARLPEYVDATVRLFEQTATSIEYTLGGSFQIDISEKIRNWLTAQSAVLVEGLPSAISSSASVLFLSPIIGFFMLKDGRQFSRELLRLVPNNIFELTLNLQFQITHHISYYIRARILESIIVGIVCLLGFWILGTPYAILLAAFAAVANLIPYIGPIFGAAPGLIFALINQNSTIEIFLILLVYIIAQIVDNFLIIPLLVARIVNLHPLSVILAVLLGAQLMGILGMLISIPLASALKVTIRSIYDHLTDYST